MDQIGMLRERTLNSKHLKLEHNLRRLVKFKVKQIKKLKKPFKIVAYNNSQKS